MSEPRTEQTSVLQRSPRSGAIELLQVFSLLMLPVAYLLLPEGWYRAAAVIVAVVLGLIPFFLVQLPEREPSPTWSGSRGFKVTPERLLTLEEIGMPNDILQAMESMKGIYYPKSKDLRKALILIIGRARAKTYMRDILLHTQYDGDPPAAEPAAGTAGQEGPRFLEPAQ
jgi:hypothetical protein